ncbi:MAG TPA: universal stress protein [Steroidobacteraceae bacterium]|nr:universal stress protein [Steroidobacteraceae bacterium]
MYAKILVPVDGSVAAKLGLQEAVKLAHSLNARISLVHVVDIYPVLTCDVAAASYDVVFDMLRANGAQLLKEAVAVVSHEGILGDSALLEGRDLQVGECIVRQAREFKADLIVCGTHGRRGVRRLVMGSDAEYIVRHSTVPVLLVRKPDATEVQRSAAAVAAA